MSEYPIPTEEQIETYEVVMPLLKAISKEFSDLSKKKPEAVLSKSKIRVVNRLLEPCKKLLAKQRSIAFLDLLEEDDAPQNSDVVLMLSQFLTAMKQFWSDHSVSGRWRVEYLEDEDEDE